MKKIGILTFHSVPNYGAILQSYALKRFLEMTSSREVSIINFQCKGNDSAFEPQEVKRNIITGREFVLKRAIKLIRYTIFTKREYEDKTRSFAEFREKYLNMDSCLELLRKKYELIVCGSDQIWNPNITGGFQDYYFGANRNQDGVRTISYAASCGDVEEICSHYEKQFFEIIRNLDKVGVREESLNRYLTDKKVNSSCNIDPTFLLSKEEYINDFLLSLSDKKYILVYALQKNNTLKVIAEKISAKLKLPVIYVCGYMAKGRHDKNELFDVAPITFLELIYNSEYVITNSFHGLAFSLIFEKNFNIVMPKSRGSRLNDLLQELRLTDRVCLDGKIDMTDVDYKEVNKLLKPHIESSKNYLINEVGAIDDGTI